MQTKTDISDILIIGAGPVGSYTASELAKQGYKVDVLEKRTALGAPVCCAGIISPKCFDKLGIPGMPVLNRFKTAQVFSPQNQILDLKRPSVQALALDRGLLDLEMAEIAIKNGARFHFGIKASHVTQNDSDIAVFTHGADSSPYRGKVLLVTAGFNPLLTAGLNLGKTGDFTIGAQSKVALNTAQPLSIFTSPLFAPGFFSWLEPLGDGTALAGLLCRKNAARHFEYFLEYLKGSGLILSSDRPLYRGLSLAPLKRTYADRLLVIGDAAGQVKPITGGGIYYGLKAADCAIEQIHHVFAHGDFSREALSGYQKAWKAEIGQDIRLGRMARRVYEKIDARRLESAFTCAIKTRLFDRLADDSELKFDDHGKVMLKILKTPAFYRVLASLLVPVSNKKLNTQKGVKHDHI
jgi:digeranylgeranylglycerophospholipid reductase